MVKREVLKRKEIVHKSDDFVIRKVHYREYQNQNITLVNSHLGDAIRKGERQVIDWKYRLKANYATIYETFNKYESPDKNLQTFMEAVMNITSRELR